MRVNTTIAGVLRSLGLSTSPGNYRGFHVHVQRLTIDTSHFLGRGHGTSNNFNPRRLSEILVEHSTYCSTHLRKRLISEGLLKEQCARCGLCPEWQGKRLTLQLDHVNGTFNDNRIENLRLLCPNCHSQTKNFAGKALAGRYQRVVRRCDCGAPISQKANRCLACDCKRRAKIDWPEASDLACEVASSSYTTVAKRLGVSDTAVRKRLKRCGFPAVRTKWSRKPSGGSAANTAADRS